MENRDDHRAASCLLPVHYKPAFAYLSLDFSRQDLDRILRDKASLFCVPKFEHILHIPEVGFSGQRYLDYYVTKIPARE